MSETRPDDPAFVEHQTTIANYHGLTKREYFAALALQGLIQEFPDLVCYGEDKYKDNCVGGRSLTNAAKGSVLAADALIAALNEGAE